jgi:ubiquitin-like-conjugating enzyme ATG3
MDKLKNTQEKVVELESGDGGWVDTHFLENKEENADGSAAASQQSETMVMDKNEVHQVNLNERKPSSANQAEAAEQEQDEEEDDDGEAVDMDEYEHNVRDDDESTVIIKPATKVKPNETEVDESKQDEEDVFIPTRTYDLNITYDNYYRTPRLWLSGYDENHKPLTIEQMYDDISEEHAKKTVTFEAHPHIPGTLMASIHPCRHAELMKKLINIVAESGKELEVYSYLMVFLKFVQSVIPTIEYDYTRNLCL